MINLYGKDEIGLIQESGKITSKALQKVLQKVSPGVTTLELDRYAEELIFKAGGKPSFKMEKGYLWTTCMNVNDMVVHGIPNDYKLREGDRLGVDLGTYYHGFHSDASWSVVVSKNRSNNHPQLSNFLTVGQKALDDAIQQCFPGNHIGRISKAMQQVVEKSGHSCVKQLVGHGVGKKLHEDPEIPCYLRGKIENTPIVKIGMVLAIEVIYNMGKSEVVYAGDDGWTIVTRDGQLSGLFEHTVAVTDQGPKILTA